MTVALVLITGFLLGQANAGSTNVVDLSCSDNAACIENMTKEFVRSVRQQKTVRVFDALTIEPLQLKTRQARSFPGPVSRFLQSHAFSFDWNDLTFKLWKDQEKSNALDFEVYESRSAKDVSEEIPKKSKSKVEEDDDGESEKKPKGGIIKRRAKKKIMQAVIPMMFGMKSTAAVIFVFMMVSALTLKAWAASKLALIVTIGMAVKRLYESYSLGIPEALWNVARYFRILFGFPPISPLTQASMQMPMYVTPQMYQQMANQMAQMPQMGLPNGPTGQQ